MEVFGIFETKKIKMKKKKEKEFKYCTIQKIIYEMNKIGGYSECFKVVFFVTNR